MYVQLHIASPGKLGHKHREASYDIAHFYREQDDMMNMYWQPGQTIPLTSGTDQTSAAVATPPSSTMMDVLQSFQASMEKQLSSISVKLESIDGRIDKIEGQLVVLEKELKVTAPKCVPSSGRSRGRLTPTALQVCINLKSLYQFHNFYI